MRTRARQSRSTAPIVRISRRDPDRSRAAPARPRIRSWAAPPRLTRPHRTAPRPRPRRSLDPAPATTESSARNAMSANDPSTRDPRTARRIHAVRAGKEISARDERERSAFARPRRTFVPAGAPVAGRTRPRGADVPRPSARSRTSGQHPRPPSRDVPRLRTCALTWPRGPKLDLAASLARWQVQQNDDAFAIITHAPLMVVRVDAPDEAAGGTATEDRITAGTTEYLHRPRTTVIAAPDLRCLASGAAGRLRVNDALGQVWALRRQNDDGGAPAPFRPRIEAIDIPHIGE